MNIQDKINNLNSGQKNALDIVKDWWRSSEQCFILDGAAGVGKAIPIDDPVLTPDGFKPMKDIHAGDLVISEKGLPIKVLWESEIQELDMYRLHFSDGTYADACKDHLWKVQTHKQRPKGNFYIKSTLDLFLHKPYRRPGKCGYRYSVPTAEAVHFPKKELPIHPYILGYILGNGCSQEYSLLITCGVDDAEEIYTLITTFDNTCIMSKRHYTDTVVHYAFHSNFREKYNSLGLYQVASKDKGIPEIYLHSSIEDRLYLLQGLMDSDGSCTDNKARFSSTSYELAHDVKWLVKSLGGTSCTHTYDRSHDNKSVEYATTVRLDRNPFLLRRKSKNYKVVKQDFTHFKGIAHIQYLKKELGKCIAVDSEEKLYVIKDFTVTHNSYVIDTIVHTLPNCNPILLCPTNEALEQLRDKVSNDILLKTVHSALGIAPTVTEKDLSFTHTKIPSFWDDYNLCIVDECFHPDVEVLTDSGFVKFSDLTTNCLVASMDMSTGLVHFEAPIRYINKPYEGNLIEVKTDKILSFISTENHDQVVYSKGTFTKRKFNDIKSYDEFYLTATSGMIDKEHITDWDRLGIAFQADGSYRNFAGAKSYSDRVSSYSSSNTAIRFSFTKERKIIRFTELLNRLNIEYHTYPNKEKTVFDLKHIPCNKVSKNLKDIFTLNGMSSTCAKEFIDEVMQWDGHIMSNQTGLYYSSVVEDNTSFVQAVAVLAGYKTNKTIQIDRRKSTYKNVHRLYISNNVKSSAYVQKKRSKRIPYKGNVYCVEMPRGTVVIRYNGHVSVSGNCSMLPEWILKLLESIKCKIIYAGHKSQLPPVVTNRSVYDKCVSPVFEKGYLSYTLKEPMRNKGDLWDFNNILEKSIYKPDTEIPDTYNIKAKDLRDYLKSTNGINDFFEGNTKIVVWTNAAVDAYNIRIRKNLFGENAKEFFLPGDKIILKAPLTVIKSLEAYNGSMLKRFASSKKTFDYLYANSKFTILNAQTIKVNLETSIFIYCYKLQVLGKDGIYDIYVPKDEKGIYHAANFYEHIAWSAKSKLEKDKRYRERHFILSCFANVKHFYCATSHTLQGSGYPNVITINSDINKNANLIERAKLRYVACSRAMNNLMYFKELTL